MRSMKIGNNDKEEGVVSYDKNKNSDGNITN